MKGRSHVLLFFLVALCSVATRVVVKDYEGLEEGHRVQREITTHKIEEA